MEDSLTREKLAEILVKRDQKENSILYKILNNGEFTTKSLNDSIFLFVEPSLNIDLVYELEKSSIDINIDLRKMYFLIGEKNNNDHVVLFKFIVPARFVGILNDNLYDNLSKTALQLVDSDSLESKKNFYKYCDKDVLSHAPDTYTLSVTCAFNHDRTLKQLTINTKNLDYLLDPFGIYSRFAKSKPIL